MSDLIDRQAAIDALDFDAELLRRALDDTDVVGAERAKYEWGLWVIESCISDVKELPSAEPESIKCEDCGHAEERGCMLFCKWWMRYTAHKGYCFKAERETDG